MWKGGRKAAMSRASCGSGMLIMTAVIRRIPMNDASAAADTRTGLANPLGLDGFEFIEFCAPERGPLEAIFAAMGFALVARHRSKAVDLWRQGEINFVINYEPRSAAAYFAAEHGPSVCGMGFRVKNARS